MVRHINDHVPVGAAVALSEQQLSSIESKIESLLGPMCEGVADLLSRPQPPAVFSSEQFDEIKALLKPGFELSSLMLADYKAQRDAARIDHSGDKAKIEPPPGEEG